jgi:hypothetical protein
MSPAPASRRLRHDGRVSEDGIRACGLEIYDLEPPGDLPPIPVCTPLRDFPRIPRRARWVPPPLPEGHARVELDEDYYAGPGWSDWDGQDAGYPARVFDIPAAQRERWRKAMEDYAAMQEEIAALRSARLSAPGFAPEGWTRKAGYQAQP